MEGLLAVGTLSNLIDTVEKGIELIAHTYKDNAGADPEFSCDKLNQSATELRSNYNATQAYLEDENDPLIARANDVAQKLQSILAELQDRAKSPLSEVVTEVCKDDLVTKPGSAVVRSDHARIVQDSRYNTTHLSDNARAHLGDINHHYHTNHYYQVDQSVFVKETEHLLQEVRDCRKLLKDRMASLMTQHADNESTPKSPSKSHEASQKASANVMKNALWYPELFSREDRIVKAHDQTFEWVFEDNHDDSKQSWDSFTSWLREGSGTYWVQGKAGSGKSTLINFLKNDPRTMESLQEWAQLTDLVVGSFFFWNSGTTLEKSLEGLYRSLLFQVLEKVPKMAECLFSDYDRDQIKNLVVPAGRDSYWSEKRLATAFRRFLSHQTRFESYCFFIDGLDEFDGDSDLLIEVLEQMDDVPHIKLCCSSRPLPVFVDAFDGCPNLRLQDLTLNDIRIYVKGELRRSKKGRKFAESKASNFESLVSKLVDKAAGVFLWVYLVVRSLQTGLRNGDTSEELLKRIDDCPEDLLDLFRKMFLNLEPRYKAQGAGIFRVLFAAPDADTLVPQHAPSVSLLDLYVSTEDALMTRALLTRTSSTNWENVVQRVRTFEQRVATVCCGLLEFSQNIGDDRGEWLKVIIPTGYDIIRTRPRLLHQSAHEFLTEQKTTHDFSVQTSYEDFERLLAARVVVVKSILRPGLSNKTIQDLADYAFVMARHVERATGRTNAALIEEIYRSCTAYANIEPERLTWFSTGNDTSDQIVKMARNPIDLQYSKSVLDDLDLLTYTIIFGLYDYALTKISDDPSLAQKGEGIPLLHSVILSDGMSWNSLKLLSWQNLVQKLLAQGADPNLVYQGHSARRLKVESKQGFFGCESLGIISQDLNWFIEHGADVNQKLHYQGLLGPVDRIRPPSDPHYVSDSLFHFDDDFGKDLEKPLEEDQASEHDISSRQYVELYDMLTNAIRLKYGKKLGHFGRITMRRRQTLSKTECDEQPDPRHTQDEADSINDDFDVIWLYICIFGKMTALKRSEHRRISNGEIQHSWEDFENCVFAFPVWELSLRYWSLIERGAVMIEPLIRAFIAHNAHIPDLNDIFDAKKEVEEKNDDNSRLVFHLLAEDERVVFTTAWNKAFPNYIIGGFSRELQRLLSLIHEKHETREFLPGGGELQPSAIANGLMSMIAAGTIPTTGLSYEGTVLHPLTEACARILGGMEVILRFGDRMEEILGLGSILSIAGPEELQQSYLWGESQACSIM